MSLQKWTAAVLTGRSCDVDNLKVDLKYKNFGHPCVRA